MSAPPISLVCAHGFLGRPEDWAAATPAIAERRLVDLLAEATPDRAPDLASLGRRLAELSPRASGWDTLSILAGYSMGGRAALESLVSQPDAWDAAVIVSASPGLSDPREREARLEADRAWAERFRREPWDELLRAWDAQPVFAAEAAEAAGSGLLARREGDFERERLAHAIERWSVGSQRDLREPLRQLRIPVLFVAGERDLRYRALAAECAALNPLFRAATVPGAGHRVLASHPGELRDLVFRFLSERFLSEPARAGSPLFHQGGHYGTRALDQAEGL